MDILVFDSAEEVVHSLAEKMLSLSKQEKSAHIALSGGSTPKKLFSYLAETAYYRDHIDWQNLHFWWGDERCVPPEDTDSNYGEAKALLFDHITIPNQNIHRIRGEDDPAAEKQRLRNELKAQLPLKLGRPQFDWIMLGVGEDGHTASLFPDQTDYATDEGVVVARHPQSGQLRLSLAVPVIRIAKRVSYLVLGESKRRIVREILARQAGSETYPAANIASSEGVTEWYLDKAAAQDLPHSI